MLIRAILPDWIQSNQPKVVEGDFQLPRIKSLNYLGYSIFYFPNSPSHYTEGTNVNGSQIDQFEWVFCDMDLKDGVWADKESFINFLTLSDIEPTKIVDSGNGVHAYWRITALDALSFLKLQRRLCRTFKTDEAVSKILQLMRLEGYINTKRENNQVECKLVGGTHKSYTCEELAKTLSPLSHSDETYCNDHYNRTYNKQDLSIVDHDIPVKFRKLLKDNNQVKELWVANQEDRSKADFRLGHLLYSNGFTKEEAMAVLMNTSKAVTRSLTHRFSYAENILNKVWEVEEAEKKPSLSSSVMDILAKSGGALKGTRFPCWSYYDNTELGFRLGQVIGLVAGSGVGKTAVSLDMFRGFVQSNPDYDHFFIPLEQPKEEIAERWARLCGEDTHLHRKVQVLSNYEDDGTYRNLSLKEIEDYIMEYQNTTGRKVGCVVIDHIGVLKAANKNGENQSLIDVCKKMKAFAQQTKTLLVMQSQAPREKAGIGDLELNKDAAYGTVTFESYLDYLITVWQPLKRNYHLGAPTVTAYKFCKIRHKNVAKDKIQEDVPMLLMFDPETQRMRQLTEVEFKAVEFHNIECTNKRKRDKKTDVVTYTRIDL